jgi:TolB-like protein/Tfp pilus assembly protein PilF
VPLRVAGVVRRCLHKDRDRRYADLDAVLKDLAGTPDTTALRPVSIAVLPFVDMSAARDQEYFCDGIAEELINALTHVAELRVVARTSAFAFKGQNLDVREIGRRLDVGAVLEGSIRRAGDRLRITAQLIDVESGYHLWSEKFDRQMEDIFAVQDEVSAAVVDSLKVRLLPAEKALLGARRTVDPEAYSLYLKGRHFAWNPSPENIAKALDCLERAAKRDPGFAPTYVAIAEAHAQKAILCISSPHESWPRANAMLERALALDDQLAEAHALAGTQALWYDWDWSRAERSFERAIALDPGLATAHAQHAWLHLAMGRTEEAVAEVRRAQVLDPLKPPFYAISAGIHWMSGRLDEALAESGKSIELDPTPGLAHLHAAAASFYKGLFNESERLLEKVASVGALSGWKESFLAFNCLARGNEHGARRIVRDLVDRKRSHHVSSLAIAQVFARLGEQEEAFAFLDLAHDERDALMPFLNLVREVDSLRASPRFKALVAKMGLPPRPDAMAATE